MWDWNGILKDHWIWNVIVAGFKNLSNYQLRTIQKITVHGCNWFHWTTHHWVNYQQSTKLLNNSIAQWLQSFVVSNAKRHTCHIEYCIYIYFQTIEEKFANLSRKKNLISAIYLRITDAFSLRFRGFLLYGGNSFLMYRC